MKITKKMLRDIIKEELSLTELDNKKAIQQNLGTKSTRKAKVGSMSPTEIQAMETLQALEKLISQPGNQMNSQMLTLLNRVKVAIEKLAPKQDPAPQQPQQPQQQQAVPVAERRTKKEGNK
jgi:hypothetical protein